MTTNAAEIIQSAVQRYRATPSQAERAKQFGIVQQAANTPGEPYRELATALLPELRRAEDEIQRAPQREAAQMEALRAQITREVLEQVQPRTAGYMATEPYQSIYPSRSFYALRAGAKIAGIVGLGYAVVSFVSLPALIGVGVCAGAVYLVASAGRSASAGDAEEYGSRSESRDSAGKTIVNNINVSGNSGTVNIFIKNEQQ